MQAASFNARHAICFHFFNLAIVFYGFLCVLHRGQHQKRIENLKHIENINGIENLNCVKNLSRIENLNRMLLLHLYPYVSPHFS